MKCKNCGGNLTLEDVVCPYCEAVNEHAIEHIRQMNRYKTDYEGTKKEVIATTQNYAGITVRIIILAVLIVLMIVCGILGGSAFSIDRDITEATRSDDKCKKQIEEYLESRDYYALAIFLEEKSISTNSEGYESFRCAIYASSQYAYFYDYVMKVVKPREGADVQGYYEWISEEVKSFYRVLDDTDFYCYVEPDHELYEYILEMEEQMHALLITYCNLTQEQVENLRNMSKAEITLLIQEEVENE